MPPTKVIYLIIAIVLLWPLLSRFVLPGRHPLQEAVAVPPPEAPPPADDQDLARAPERRTPAAEPDREEPGATMTRPILAGADGTDSGLDAVAFGARLAGAVGALTVVCVSPEQAEVAGAEAEADVERHAAAILEAAREVAMATCLPRSGPWSRPPRRAGWPSWPRRRRSRRWWSGRPTRGAGG